MALSSTEIYRSQNGDTWWLIRDDASHQVHVRHEANPASGGHVTEMSVERFLSRRGSGPEYAATQELLKAQAEEAKLLASTASLPPDESA
ncbi:hypothetical protein [Roseomonas marmotae]|uniref:DUF2188 domain-containing protein n=1 Tax=Roseomonas marmotae TaxID=2768161 RepID=A0ABS3KIH8_9PROT|nr:hypothetical protein [Roseomonas marmotae]MBO1077257.1 hypothetical protein [Roseomonas marmotae]